MNLNEAKLQQRSKELDAREEYLDAKLKTLDEAPVTLKVYEARFKVFEDKLESIQAQIKITTQECEEIQEYITLIMIITKNSKKLSKKTSYMSMI